MVKYIIRNLKADDYNLVRHFSCGDNLMDAYLAIESYKRHLLGEGITKLVEDIETKEIIAYFTLKCSSIPVKDKEMYEDEIRYMPSVEISRLAVVKKLQHQSIGTKLLGYIIDEIKTISEIIGCYSITLFASLKYVEWYQKDFEFEIWDINKSPDEDGLTFMYLKITDNKKLEELHKYQSEHDNLRPLS